MLRLPRSGYIENIWDHAPAYVVITEAGGKVSDTSGKELDFSKGIYDDLRGGPCV